MFLCQQLTERKEWGSYYRRERSSDGEQDDSRQQHPSKRQRVSPAADSSKEADGMADGKANGYCEGHQYAIAEEGAQQPLAAGEVEVQ